MPPTNQTTLSRQGSLPNLGQILSQKRQERQMSLLEVARRTGLTPSYLSQLEQGRFQDIGVEKFCRVIEALNLSAERVLVESGYLSQPKNSRSKETNQ